MKSFGWCAHLFLDCGLEFLQAVTCAGIGFVFWQCCLKLGCHKAQLLGLSFKSSPAAKQIRLSGQRLCKSGESDGANPHFLLGELVSLHVQSVSAAQPHSTHGLQHPQDTKDFWSEFHI